MEGIKNLIIDLGGVLINLTRNRCIEAFENLGVENIREQMEKFIFPIHLPNGLYSVDGMFSVARCLYRRLSIHN